jgi:hypothetical protein
LRSLKELQRDSGIFLLGWVLGIVMAVLAMFIYVDVKLLYMGLRN